jgi:uncharacterized sulfatase
MGHDKAKYPLELIFETAEGAARTQPQGTPQWLLKIDSPDNAVRYWKALGVLARGEKNAVLLKNSLLPLLNDESPSVRVVAAEALATYGGKDDAHAGLKILLVHADAKKNSLYVSLAALNAIDRLGEKARPIAKEVLTLPTEPTDAKHRAAMGVSRLLASIRPKLEK